MDKKDTNSTSEIEITREMREAGAAAIFEWRDFSTAWDLAEEVYRAMERERAERPILDRTVDGSNPSPQPL